MRREPVGCDLPGYIQDTSINSRPPRKKPAFGSCCIAIRSAASDYGLLNERTLEPRPNYWGALLWRLLMGRVVLDPGAPVPAGLHVYAHCQRGRSGGVSLLILNVDRSAPHVLTLPTASERYTLDAASLQDTTVRLNGLPLRLGSQEDLPRIAGVQTAAGVLTFAPASITFLTMTAAGNNACQ